MQKWYFFQAEHLWGGRDYKAMHLVYLCSFLITLATSVVNEGRETPSGSTFKGSADALNTLQIGLSFPSMPLGEYLAGHLRDPQLWQPFPIHTAPTRPARTGPGKHHLCLLTNGTFCAKWNNVKRSHSWRRVLRMFIWCWVCEGGCLPVCMQWGILCLEQRAWKKKKPFFSCPRNYQLHTCCVVKDVLTLFLRAFVSTRKVLHPSNRNREADLFPSSSMSCYMSFVTASPSACFYA